MMLRCSQCNLITIVAPQDKTGITPVPASQADEVSMHLVERESTGADTISDKRP